MPKIKFHPSKNLEAIVVEYGAGLMATLLSAGRPVSSSCFGKGICSKCRVRVISGHENLSEETEFVKALRERNHIPDDFCISCQTQVNGDVCIDTDYW